MWSEIKNPLNLLHSPTSGKFHKKDIKDHAERVKNTICIHIDLLPGNHDILTDIESKFLIFKTFPKTWRLVFSFNRNDHEQVSEKQVKDFVEKRKETVDREDSIKKKAKAKVKIEESMKKEGQLTQQDSQLCPLVERLSCKSQVEV